MKNKKQFLTLLLTLFIAIIHISAQEKPTMEVLKLTDDIYRLTSLRPYSVHFLAYVTEDGILMVDAGQKQTGSELRTVLDSIAKGNKQVKYLINSHAHIDHTGGNFALAEEEPIIIGSDLLRSTLKSYSYVLYEFPENALPQISFTDSMRMNFGDEEIRLISTPGSHDLTDIMIHFVKSNIVYMGDISYGMQFPSIDSYTGNFLKYPEVIEKIIPLIPTDAKIVSGHGRICSAVELKQYGELMAKAIAIVQDEMAKGKDLETMQQEDILKDVKFRGYENKNRRDNWVRYLENAGPSTFINSLAYELHSVLIHNDADAAIAHYFDLKSMGTDKYPFESGLVFRTADWLLTKDRKEDAIKLLKFSINEFPKGGGQQRLGNLYMNDGNIKEALNYYEQFVKIYPKYYGIYVSIAKAYLKDGKKKLAIQNYEKAVELNPNNMAIKEALRKLKGDK